MVPTCLPPSHGIKYESTNFEDHLPKLKVETNFKKSFNTKCGILTSGKKPQCSRFWFLTLIDVIWFMIHNLQSKIQVFMWSYDQSCNKMFYLKCFDVDNHQEIIIYIIW